MVKPMRSSSDKIYKLQIKDKACTICVNVSKGGKICKECTDSGNRNNWKNAF